MRKAVYLMFLLSALYGCAGSAMVSGRPEIEGTVKSGFNGTVSSTVSSNGSAKKESPMRKEVRVRKESRSRTKPEKAGVILKETGKGAAVGTVAGGVTGAVIGKAVGKEPKEAAVVGGAAGAVVGGVKGLSEGIKKAREPVSEEVTTVKVFPGVKGLRAVFPRRHQPYVLRVWIAPWRDEKDRLRWSRYVYVDLSINRWNLGEKSEVVSQKELLQLLSTVSGGRVRSLPNRLRDPKGIKRPSTESRQTKPQ